MLKVLLATLVNELMLGSAEVLRRKLRMCWLATLCQLFGELIPIGNVNRQCFLEHPEERLLDCCILVVQLKIRDGFALMIDVTLAALNAAVGFLKMSLQKSCHRTSTEWQWEERQFLRRVTDRSPLPRAMHDSRNSHRAETECGLRLIG